MGIESIVNGVKAIGRIPLKVVDGYASQVAGAVGGISFSQIPGFISHYTQRLGGHATEAAKHVADYTRIAADNGVDLARYIADHVGSGVDTIMATGAKIKSDLLRSEYLTSAYDSIRNADIIQKPIEFVTNFDYDIAVGALKDFVPNVPLSVEGAVYAAVGIGVGWGAYKLATRGIPGAIGFVGRKIRGR